jgi:hypothetical protein
VEAEVVRERGAVVPSGDDALGQRGAVLEAMA